jgi:hypothetical protein
LSALILIFANDSTRQTIFPSVDFLGWLMQSI